MNNLSLQHDNPLIQCFAGVRCYVDDDGVAQLNLEDVARGLGFTTVAASGNMVVRWNTVYKNLCDLGVATSCNGTNYREMCPDFIPEPIFYLFSMKANNDTAKGFQNTIAYEVLPSIRKHGAYATEATIHKIIANPDFGIELLTTLKVEQEKNKLLEVQNEELKAELDESHEWYSIKRVASLNGISWKTLDWRKLKAAGECHGYHPKKVFDPNFGQVNVYHRTAWEEAYPHLEL